MGIKKEELFILIVDENTDSQHRWTIREIFLDILGYNVVFNFAFDVPAVILIQNKGTILDSFFCGPTKASSRLILFTPSDDDILRAAARDRVIKVLPPDYFKYTQQEPICPQDIALLAIEGKSSSQYNIPEDSNVASESDIINNQPEFDPEAFDFDNLLEQRFPRPRTPEDELAVKHIKRHLNHDFNLFID